MNSNQSDEIIQRYLSRVEVELSDLPPAQRQEIIDDLRVHIDDALATEPDPSPATVRNLLDRLGDPAELAREARERNGMATPLPPPPQQPAAPQHPPVYETVKTGPGGLEIIAIVLSALMWPIGIVLAWVSPRWLGRDKVIATIIPLIGGAVLVASLMPVAFGVATVAPVEVAPRVVQPMYDAPSFARDAPMAGQARSVLAAFPRLFMLALILFAFASPLLSALYLAIRIQPLRETMRAVPNDRPGGWSAHSVA